METKLERISQMSRENPKMIFSSIGHLINKEMLKSCHETMDGTKAKGIDGVSKEEYEQFCAVLELDKEQTEFLDMSADKETDGKLHVYSIFAAKGLEFPKVLVFTVNMSRNQKTVACTRALESLCTVGKGVMRTEIE